MSRADIAPSWTDVAYPPLADRGSAAPSSPEPAPDASAAHQALLSGWGRTAPSRALLLAPRSIEQAAQAVAQRRPDGRGLIARGAGRSYGDAAQNGGGAVLDMRALRGIAELDAERLLIRAAAGTTFAQLLLALAARGLTLPVVPGTRHVTVGGAIAADAHGKNHPRDGSLARQLESILLCTPAHGPLAVSRECDPELFHGTIGGMGLTGVILEATLRVTALRAPRALADVDRVASVPDALALMDGAGAHRYAIAWLDLLSSGAGFGRAVVTRSEEGAPEGSARRLSRAPLRARPRVSVPADMPRGLLSPAIVRAFNALHWRSAPRRTRGRELSMSAQLFPLDALGAWNRLYGPAGLVQYQFAVPHGAEETLLRVLHGLRARRAPMYLAVLKRFGEAAAGPLSFPLPGWTVAIDLPADAPDLLPALDAADELVAAVGGRVYLAKDVRLRADLLRVMYPELPRLLQLRARVDPQEHLRSDMAWRLGLCA
ncbi:MAG TPA: FAD-binding oxidoreductase [Solirubrobacteraceae bacterium]|nr:FAD-binding oxidoreductase [Solirubrobacteraceae bacterium]